MFVFVLNEKHIFLMGISSAIDSETDLCKLLYMYTDLLQQKGKIFKSKPFDRPSRYIANKDSRAAQKANYLCISLKCSNLAFSAVVL